MACPVSGPALAAGSSYSYRFPLRTPGTYWMHSHQGLQEQQLAAAPLIIHDPAEAALDRQEVVVLLHDFSFRSPEEILADLTKSTGASAGMGAMAMGGTGMDGTGMAGMNMGGSNRNGSGMGGMDMSGMNMSGMNRSGMNMGDGNMSGMGQGGMKPDLNDVDYDAFLANGRTLEDPEVFPVEKGGRVRLRLINGAASTNFTIDTGALGATLIAVDGQGVKPVEGRRFPISVAQRLDLWSSCRPKAGPFPSSPCRRVRPPAPESFWRAPAPRSHAWRRRAQQRGRCWIFNSKGSSVPSEAWRSGRLIGASS
jgi:FtsP/CotA-like multicopper oxidase with cupredoxin domain